MSTVFRGAIDGARPAATVATVSRATLVGLLVIAGAIRLSSFTVPMETQAAIYLLGMVALNLPHGGYEHFANLRRRVAQFRWWYVGGYLAMIGGTLVVFLVAPVAGLALAVAVAVAKGGGGDLYVLQATAGTGHLRTRAQRLLAVAARGGAVMAVPIVAFPETFHGFSSLMVTIFQPGALGAVSGAFDVTGPLIGVGYAACVIAHVGLGYRRRDGSGSWLVDAAETGLLVAYFAVVPVVIAVGLYFPLWYSARQVARELAVESEPGEGSDLLGGPDADAASVALRAWGTLVAGAAATGAVVALIWFVAPNPLAQSGWLYGGVAFWSIAISIVAFPHVVVGGVLDRKRGIWHVP